MQTPAALPRKQATRGLRNTTAERAKLGQEERRLILRCAGMLAEVLRLCSVARTTLPGSNFDAFSKARRTAFACLATFGQSMPVSKSSTAPAKNSCGRPGRKDSVK
eukprot:1109404-Pleurochrysis_carterae.AAC.3